MKVRILSFTQRGEETAKRLSLVTGGRAERCQSGGLDEWTKEAFSKADAILFVGAAGIAVRAIAPYLKSKLTDPAVLVIDELGTYVIPILSGHVGGANQLARELADAIGAEAVITTATDRNGLFAVDSWAVREECRILNPERIKAVSGKLLSGEEVCFYSECEILGRQPDGLRQGSFDEADFALTIHRQEKTEGKEPLLCIPKILTLGVGCKKGKSEEEIEESFFALLQEEGLYEEAIQKVCSIDLKKEEPGLLAFCRKHGWSLETFSAEKLKGLEGCFSASAFVKETVGVDNVCERSALLGAEGEEGKGNLLCKKKAGNGITLALGQMDYHPKWE